MESYDRPSTEGACHVEEKEYVKYEVRIGTRINIQYFGIVTERKLNVATRINLEPNDEKNTTKTYF